MLNLISRIISCVDRKSKIKFYNLQLIIILLSILNIISIILIAPFITIFSNHDIILQNNFFKKVLKLFDFFDKDDLFFIIALALLIFYSLTVIFTFILNYLNIKWSQQISVYFKNILYNYYINKDWLYHSSTSSKNLIARINNDSDRLTNQLILPITEFFSGFIFVSFMFFTIFLVNFSVAIISLILLFIFYISFYFLFKKKLRRSGDEFTKLYPLYYKTLSDGFSSIKDTILFDRKTFFTKNFFHILSEMKKNSILQSFLTQIPRGIIEILFLFLIIFFLNLLVKKFEYSFVEISSLMGFYVVVCIKAIPALQKLYRNFSIIKANESAFENLEIDLLEAKKFSETNLKKDENHKIELKNKIQFKNLSFNYPNNKNAGIFDVNIDIQSGFKVGIAGKTGSGKSTLVDILLGFLSPLSGQILIDGKILDKSNLKSWQEKISYVPQTFFISETTIKSNVAFGEEEELIDTGKVKLCLKIAELEEFENDLDKIVGENGKKLSGGERQRLGIARAIYKDTEIIVLDEATSALDTNTEKKIVKNLHDYDRIKTVIVVSHRLDTLKNCNKLFFVDDGHISELSNFDELLNKF
jgi:ABC-type multidrug transport system fused ATPase/permease subunit